MAYITKVHKIQGTYSPSVTQTLLSFNYSGSDIIVDEFEFRMRTNIGSSYTISLTIGDSSFSETKRYTYWENSSTAQPPLPLFVPIDIKNYGFYYKLNPFKTNVVSFKISNGHDDSTTLYEMYLYVKYQEWEED